MRMPFLSRTPSESQLEFDPILDARELDVASHTFCCGLSLKVSPEEKAVGFAFKNDSGDIVRLELYDEDLPVNPEECAEMNEEYRAMINQVDVASIELESARKKQLERLGKIDRAWAIVRYAIFKQAVISIAIDEMRAFRSPFIARRMGEGRKKSLLTAAIIDRIVHEVGKTMQRYHYSAIFQIHDEGEALGNTMQELMCKLVQVASMIRGCVENEERLMG